MATYYKPQSPIQSGEDFIYPITTADQIMKSDKSRRLEQAGLIVADNSTSLGGVAAKDYARKTDTAQDSNKLGGKSANEYALKTDTAPDSNKLGGKAPEYYLRPRNLLDNSDFSNPVNQRGKNSYSTIGYTIDRWKLDPAGNSGITLTDSGVKFGSTSSLVSFSQNLSEEVRKRIAGKTVTAVAIASDGSVGIVRETIPKTGLDVDSMQVQIGGSGISINIFGVTSWNSLSVRLLGDTSSGLTITHVALYEGSYTADTLPPYVPKGYAAELAECQRYYLPVSGYWNMGVVLTGTGYICLNIPTNIKMRITPNVIISGAKAYHPTYDWFDLTYQKIEWHAPFYRIIFNWPSSIQSSISDIVLINGVTGLSADL